MTQIRIYKVLRKVGLGAIVTLIILLSLSGWLLLHPPPGLLPQLSPFICPGATYGVETEQKIVALTLDDGPDLLEDLDLNTTGEILHLLATYQARATFFLISDKLQTQVGRNLTSQMVSEGHELGHHMTVDEWSVNLDLPEFKQKFAQADRALTTFTQPHWFRPAGGWCRAEQVKFAQDQGYQVVLGSLWPYDTSIASSHFASRYILSNLHPGGIVILHDDGEGRGRGQRSLVTLQQVLPELHDRGYQVVTLSELLSQGTPITHPRELPGWLEKVRLDLLSLRAPRKIQVFATMPTQSQDPN